MIYICIFMIIGCGKSNDKNEEGIFTDAKGKPGGHDLQVVYANADTFFRYLELKSVSRNGDIVSSWEIMDFSGAQLKQMKEEFNAASSKLLVEYNCVEKTTRTIRSQGYSGKMASGDLLDDSPGNASSIAWVSVRPNTVGDTSLKSLCKLTQSNASAPVAPAAPTPVVTASVPAAPTQASATPAAPVVDNTQFSPSFDCAKVSNSMEKMICGDRQLSALDVKLSQTYSNALSTAQDKQKLKSEQITWIKQARTCADVACVQQSLQQRINQLNSIK